MEDSAFNEWNRLKKELHFSKKPRVHFREREIWFISIGKNIATEIYGKGDDFLRPVIVFRKIGRYNFLGIPLTSQLKEDNPYRVKVRFRDRVNDALLNQIRVFDAKRVVYKIGNLSKESQKEVERKFLDFYRLTPSKGEGGILTKREQRKEDSIIQENSSDVKYFAHKSAYIDDNVHIGNNTKIWHFSHILSHTTIGENCSFGQNCVVGPKVTVGNGVKVQNNISIYEGVEIEDDVFLGPSMVFTNVINPRAFIQRKDEFKKTLLKKGCSVGANATIVCGVTIGEYALIGSGAVVNKDVKPYALMVGVPARQIGWVGVSGNTLHFDDEGKAVDSDGRKYAIMDDQLKEL